MCRIKNLGLLGKCLGWPWDRFKPIKNVWAIYTYIWPVYSFSLREFVYELPSSWPPARVEGGSGLQSMTPDSRESRESRDPLDPGIVAGGLLLSNAHTLSAYWQVQDGPDSQPFKSVCLVRARLKILSFVDARRHVFVESLSREAFDGFGRFWGQN